MKTAKKKPMKMKSCVASYTRVVGNHDNAIDEVIAITQKSKDTALLSSFLNDLDRPVTPKLRTFIADELKKTSPPPGKKKPITLFYPKEVYENFITCMKAMLDAAELDPGLWAAVKNILPKEIQDNPRFLTKGEKTHIAKTMAESAYKITSAQLDEILNPRKSREKMP